MLADFSASVFCRIGGSAQACQAEYAGSIRVIGSNGIFQEIGRPDPKTGRSLAAAPQPPSLPGNPFALVPPIAPGSPSSQQQHRTRDEFGPLATVDFCDESVLTAIEGIGARRQGSNPHAVEMDSRWARLVPNVYRDRPSSPRKTTAESRSSWQYLNNIGIRLHLGCTRDTIFTHRDSAGRSCVHGQPRGLR